MRFKTMLLAAAGALAMVLAVACGGDGDEAPPSTGPGTPPVSSGGSVAPNVFMTFEEGRYRARDVGSDLVSRGQLELVGTTDQIDIDHAGPVEVYRLKDGSSDVLYTFQPGRSLPEEEGGSIPNVWIEWAPAEEGSTDGGSTEPGGIGGSRPGEPVAPPPGAGPTLPPDDVVSATPVPGTETKPDASVPVEAAVAHLASRLDISVDAIQVVSVEAVDWPDGCLGAGGPDEACTQVITPGYRVVLAVDGAQYVYHTGTGGYVRPAP